MEKTKKPVAFAISLALVVVLAVAGAIAWLTDKSEEVTNTFTAGDINITLTETTGSTYKMIPGDTLNKDPKVTVLYESEPCYLFVQIKKDGYKFDDYLDFGIADGWTELESAGDDTTDVYYRLVNYVGAEAGESFHVLKDNQVKVGDNVTKEMMDDLEGQTAPTLKFKAFAVQQANIESASDAWGQIPESAYIQ